MSVINKSSFGNWMKFGRRLVLAGTLAVGLIVPAMALATTLTDGQGAVGSNAQLSCKNPTIDPGCCKPCHQCDTGTGAGDSLVLADSNSYMGSYLENVSTTYLHYATDYSAGSSGGGCSTCGGSSGADQGRLPSFELTRYHRYSRYFDHGSFGPAGQCNYDMSLVLYRDTTRTDGSGWIDMIDPTSAPGDYEMHDNPSGSPDGVYVNETPAGTVISYQMVKQLVLLSTLR